MTTETAIISAQLQNAVNLRHAGKYQEAKEVAGAITFSHPENISAWHTLGQCWTELGNFDAAYDCHRLAMEGIKSQNVQNLEVYQKCALALAQCMMRMGRFESGLPLWEAGRLGVSWKPWPGAQYFDGKGSYEGKSLLVQSEGGYGDTFMFMRWLPLLKDRFGFAKIGLMVWKPLVDFCDWSALGIDQVFEIDKDKAKFDWNYATSIMSMPAVFGMKTWEDVPCSPFFPGKGHVHSTTTFRLGFTHRAEENSSPVRTKSLPLHVSQEVADLMRETRIYSLSPEKSDLYNTAGFAQPVGVCYEPARMTSWKATAEYVCSMDFVLTVDTACAHLAGLLGVPALVILPTSSCWRWRMPGENPVWYGPHVSYFRQQVPLEWDAADIVKALKQRIG